MSKVYIKTKDKSKSDKWYSDKKLKDLLEFYVDSTHINISEAFNTPEQLRNHLKEIVVTDKLQYIIPLNINALTGELGINTNHWVSLYVIINNTNQSIEVNYVNPMGYPINVEIQEFIEHQLRQSFTTILIKQPLLDQAIQHVDQLSDIEFYGNTNDCGPILVYATACLTRALDFIRINSLEESISLGSYLRESFNKKKQFNDIYTTLSKNSNNFSDNGNISISNTNSDSKQKLKEKTEVTKLDQEAKEPIDKQELEDIKSSITELEKKLFPNLHTNVSDHLPDPAEEKEKILKQIIESYKLGLDKYQANEFDEAEKQFVKVLKPTLSKSSMKNLYINTEEVKEKVLSSMYHLGLVYLKNDKYPQHHSKATAIFQYCRGFAEKYQTAIKLEGNITGNSAYFIKQAYLVEKEFLKSIEIETINQSNNQNPKNLTNVLETSNDNYYNNAQQKSANYKQELENIRETTKQKLNAISNLTIKNITERAKAVENIYQECNSFFVNHNGNKSDEPNDQKTGLIQRLLTECYKQLGYPPEGCVYTIIGLGSLALGTMTPWSDLEFAILVNDEKYKEYFRNLSKLFHIKVINLGETHLKSIGVESLNNFKTDKLEDEWFWDDVMKIKFNFDSARWDACKVPLGRQGEYKVSKKVKDADGEEKTVTIIKPDYELILTPEEMAAFQKEEKTNLVTEGLEQKMENWFESDKYLVQALRSVSFIDGSLDLLDDYREKVIKVEKPEILQGRALQKLKDDVDQFSLKLGDEEEGKLIDTKQDIYRLGDRVINSLANYYNITAAKGQSVLTVWQMIYEMKIKGIISPEGAEHLKEAIGIATELRLRTYSNNDTREERASTYVPAVEHLNDEGKRKLLEETFHIKDTSILHHFYYVMISMQKKIKLFCNEEYNERVTMLLKNEELFDNSNYYKGMVHARFLEYDRALKYMEAAKKERPENLDFLEKLFSLYNKTGAIEEVINTGAIILELVKTKYKGNHDLFVRYNHLGTIHEAKGEYKEAIKYYLKGLEIWLKAYLYNPNHLNIAKSYNNLGTACLTKGEYEKAIKYYQQSLVIRLKVYLYSPNHLDIAMSYNSLGVAYEAKGEYEKATKYHRQGLTIQLKAHSHNPNHPDIFSNYNDLGNTYRNKGDYAKAIEYYQQALAMQLKVYAHIPNHPDIAISYNNLGLAYLAKGEYRKATKYHQQGLTIWLKTYSHSPNHPNIAKNYNNLGNAYHNEGKYEKAIKYHQLGLEILLKAYLYSPNHSNIAASYNNLGAACLAKGEYKEAIKYYQQGLAVMLKTYSHNPSHSNIAKCYNNLGIAYLKNGEYEEAIKYYQQELAILFKAYSYSFNHSNIAITYDRLIYVYLIKGNYEQAYFYIKKALENYSIIQNQQFTSTFTTLHKVTLIQLGNMALLDNNAKKARHYFKLISPKYKNIYFNSPEFIYLQLQEAKIAYEINLLLAGINCQKILINVDPQLRYGNYYHNLACFYVCNGNVREADEAFTQAFNKHPNAKITGQLQTEYAQFLILNRNNIISDIKEISNHLYSVIYNDNTEELLYGKIERANTCTVIRDIIKQKNSTIKVNSKVLAYYLLITYPEYIKKNDDIKILLKDFCNYCDNLQNEISFKLLSDAYTLIDNKGLALKYLKQAKLIEQVNAIIVDKTKFDNNSNIDFEDIEKFAADLDLLALNAISEKRLKDAQKLFTKIVQIYESVLINNPEKLQIAANKLATFYLITNNIKQFSELKLFYPFITLDHNLIKLINLDIDQIIVFEHQLYNEFMLNNTRDHSIDEQCPITNGNQLLNHGALFKNALEIFRPERILGLVPKLNLELINEAIENNDSLLILSGLISLDNEL